MKRLTKKERKLSKPLWIKIIQAWMELLWSFCYFIFALFITFERKCNFLLRVCLYIASNFQDRKKRENYANLITLYYENCTSSKTSVKEQQEKRWPKGLKYNKRTWRVPPTYKMANKKTIISHSSRFCFNWSYIN